MTKTFARFTIALTLVAVYVVLAAYVEELALALASFCVGMKALDVADGIIARRAGRRVDHLAES